MSRRSPPSGDFPPPDRVRALQHTARDAARSAGALVGSRHRPTGVAMREKGAGDFVTEVDLEAESLLREHLSREWPGHGILGEEQAAERLDADFVWIVDPIDGTSNFGRGLPTFAVSVACTFRGQPVAAGLHCFPEDVTYHAGLGLGAFRGEERLELSRGKLGAGSMIAVQWFRGPRHLGYLDEVVATGTRIRNLGCTVAQVCDVAAGRLHANVQEQGRVWDFAGAALLLTEAGGRFTGWDGAPIFPMATLDGSRHYPSIGAPPGIHDELVALLRRHVVEVPSR